MGGYLQTRNGVNIYEYTGEYCGEGKAEVNGIIGEGMESKLYKWMQENGYDETLESIDNNTSGFRNGNEKQFYDNYPFDDGLEISWMYYYNGTVWIVLYDTINDRWYGEFEL